MTKASRTLDIDLFSKLSRLNRLLLLLGLVAQELGCARFKFLPDENTTWTLALEHHANASYHMSPFMPKGIFHMEG